MVDVEPVPTGHTPRVPSPSGSICSVSSSRSGTLSRPPPPPKPSHLSCVFTGTVNSTALREYIQAQKTGESFTGNGIVRNSFSGYGYGYGTFDTFQDALDGEEEEEQDAIGTERPGLKNRTFTAPSVSNIFAPTAEEDAGNGTTRLVRNEPISIDGTGASRVGNLRSMFEAPSQSKMPVVARQKTGTISSKVSMLQAQITGDAVYQRFNYAPTHQSEASDTTVMYQTAKEDMLEEVQEQDVISEEPAALDSDTPLPDFSTLRSSPTCHDRDDSSATIRPGQINPSETPTQRKRSGHSSPAGGSAPSRLSSVFAASPSPSTLASPRVSTADNSHSSSPNARSVASREGVESDQSRDERSREPSMLVDAEAADTSAHMRAHDGSSFDFDWINGDHSQDIGDSSLQLPDLLADLSVAPFASSSNRASVIERGVSPFAVRAGPPPQRPESIVLHLESQVEGMTSEEAAELGATASASKDELAAVPSQTPTEQDGPTTPGPQIPQPGIGMPARALYDFMGEASFNELSLKAGQTFDILNEELRGGWSLGVVWDEDGMPLRGLIPQGWYCYIQDFTMAPPPAQGIEPPPTPVPDNEDEITQATSTGPPRVPAICLPTAAEAEKTSPVGSKRISRITSIGSAITPLVSVSNANAPGGTWKVKANGNGKENDAARTLASVVRSDSGLQPREADELTKTPRASYFHLDASEQSQYPTHQDLAFIPLPASQSHGSLPISSTLLQLSKSQSSDSESQPFMFGWRISILGGKTLNRFSPFVTSRAEEYILAKEEDSNDTVMSRSMARKVSGSSAASVEDSAPGVEEDQHFVLAGPAGPRWKSKTPPFLVQVHSPEKRSKMSGMQEYTVFCVTSTFPAPREDKAEEEADKEEEGEVEVPYDPTSAPDPPGPSLTVYRRFTQFAWLHQVLLKHYAPLVIPSLPEKQYSGRFASEFISTRRADLELWLSRIVRHPVLRYSEALLFFLSCDDDLEWKLKASRMLRTKSKNMFARTWHPDFNFDASEAELEAEAIEEHLESVEKTMHGFGGGMMGAWKGHREGAAATCSTYRDLSYSLLRMVTGTGVGDEEDPNSSSEAHYIHGPPMGNVGKRSTSGATNEHGVWCWREGCHECTNLTYALQNTAEALQDVADLYDEHARSTLLRSHERLRDISRPHTSHAVLLETHRTTLAKYSEDDRTASRCETVLNVTLAELDRVHNERTQDFYLTGRSFLDDEIELYENVLETLKAARAHYEPQYYDCEKGIHILPSRYTADLHRPRKEARQLPMPSSGGGGFGMQSLMVGGLTRPASTGGSLPVAMGGL